MPAGRRRISSALPHRQGRLREVRHAGSEAGVTSLPTLGSPITDKDLWQRARQQLAQHGDDAMVATAMKMDAMLEAGGHAGYATWAGIALRSAKLGPQADAGETRH